MHPQLVVLIRMMLSTDRFSVVYQDSAAAVTAVITDKVLPAVAADAQADAVNILPVYFAAIVCATHAAETKYHENNN